MLDDREADVTYLERGGVRRKSVVVEREKVEGALCWMKCGKASGVDWIIVEFLRSGCSTG